MGCGKEGGSGPGPARVRGDRFCGGGFAAGGGCERQADDFDHRDCQGDERGDRGADGEGEVWGDARRSNDKWLNDIQQERFEIIVII